MATVETFRNIQRKLHLDSHFATERFGVVLAMFAVSALALVGSLGASAVDNARQAVAATALYTPTFMTSLTQLTGEASGVYVSPDRTRALVMMSFGADASAALSADAGNYQAFVAGSTTSMEYEPLRSELSGQIVRFGSTGYIGVVIDAADPFPEQILNLTVRSNSQLVYTPGQSAEVRAAFYGDESFGEYDQWRVYLNPGAGDAVEFPRIGSAGDPFDVASVYYDLVTGYQEHEFRASLDTQLAAMRVELARIDEYTAQAASTEVGGLSLKIPPLPAAIDGDTITGSEGSEDDPLTLHTDWVAPAGYDFDWRAGDVKTGYLDSLTSEGQTYVQFLSAKASEVATEEPFRSGALPWTLNDGTNLVANSSAEGLLAPLISVMNNLSQAYDNYYAAKVAYQTTGYQGLINLEVELSNVERATSVNDTAEALLAY